MHFHREPAKPNDDLPETYMDWRACGSWSCRCSFSRWLIAIWKRCSSDRSFTNRPCMSLFSSHKAWHSFVSSVNAIFKSPYPSIFDRPTTYEYPSLKSVQKVGHWSSKNVNTQDANSFATSTRLITALSRRSSDTINNLRS